LQPDARNQEPVVGSPSLPLEVVLHVKRQPQLLGNLEVVETLHLLLVITRTEARLRVPDTPEVERTEHNSILHLKAEAPEVILVDIRVGPAVASEQTELIRQLLVEAQ